jgi:hypothetical protein
VGRGATLIVENRYGQVEQALSHGSAIRPALEEFLERQKQDRE